MTVENTETTTEIADALVDAPQVAETVETPSISEEDELGAAYDRIVTQNGADRGEDGKFKSAKEPVEGDEASLEGEDGDGGDGGSSTVSAASPAPANWQGLDDVWKTIPPEHQEKVKAHFDELHRRMSDQGRMLAGVKPIADRLSQAVTQHPEFNGMNPDQLAEGAIRLAAVQAKLNKDPIGTMIEVAKSYNVLPQLQAALNGQQMPEEQQVVSSLQQEIAGLKQQLAAVSDPTQIEGHVSRAFESRAAQDAVNQFATDPANSFWADVEPQMAGFIAIAKGQQPNAPIKDVLKSAYDMAVNALPEVRAKVEAAAKKAAAQQPDPKRTEAAKKAASINVKSTSTGKERQMTEDEALGAAYDRVMAS